MVLSSVFLIGTFTFIQINNQLQRVQEFNLFRAKQGALVVKDQLSYIFSNAPAEATRSQLEAQIKNAIQDLIKAGIVQTVVVYSKGDNPVILEGDLSLVFEEDQEVISGISKAQDKTQWLLPVIDREHRLINLFININNPYDLVFKLIFSLGNLQEALNQVYAPVIFTIIIVIIANIVLSAALSGILIRPVRILNQASKDVALGNLDLKISINTKDELEELSDTFNYMTEELKKMKARAENANPLTKLPGNIVIQEEAEKRIKENRKFVLIYSDLDNFKAFNDKYGVHKGDQAIIMNSDILKEAVAKFGNSDDFVGHEGGDDFLLLTTPEKAPAIADYIIKEFDERIRPFYLKEDLEKGFIEAHSRESEEIRRFPIMTISLVGVGNYSRKIDSYSQLTNIAAEVKKVAKGQERSIFVLDRRSGEPGKGAEHRSTNRPNDGKRAA